MLKMMKGPEERHTMLFSATISQRVGHLSWEFMNDPEAIVINPEQVTVEEITQEIYHVSAREKVNLLLGLLRREQPENALIFTNTKDMAVKLAKRLSLNGFHAKFIMGDLPQRKRMSIIKQIKEGELQLLVATDVAARGLHINDLDLVVNYDIPEDPESYVHRIGRTARVGKSGKAITLACEKYVYGLEAIEKFIDMKIPVQWADEELYQSEDKSAGVKVSGNRERGNDRKDGREQRGGGGRDKRSGGRSGQGRSGGQGRSSRDRSGDTARRNSDGGSGSRNRSRGGQSTSGRPAEHTAQTKAEKPGGKPGGKSGGNSNRKEPAKAQASRNGGSEKGGSRKGAPHKGAPQKGAPEKTPSKDSDLNSRLAYYRKKYGEDFQLTDSTSSKKDGNGKENRRPAGGHAQKNKAQRKRSSDNGQSVKEREEAPVSGEEKKKKKGLISRLLGG
jgi:ATP-dependent RNA helicase RhlB